MKAFANIPKQTGDNDMMKTKIPQRLADKLALAADKEGCSITHLVNKLLDKQMDTFSRTGELNYEKNETNKRFFK
ncbi:hypothetical protein JQC92_02950 [Shewanella sp. 202IG2-18]|uniref:hypothetical protein n=1 Tax=Parashewanella hymeniacidonis TaxID=2807618 RepID=UPI0019619AF4|nr:hypothetical protein [Parashewanella hymeniacidonis]MBM7070999.1 hypothetical protein [Parashewanella hymeniacidonis]